MMAGFDPQAFVGKYGGDTPPGSGGAFDPAAFVAKHDASAPAPTTLQEMHPDFTAADRLVVKNFANGNDEGADYLQRQHPELEVKVDGGQIKARRKDGSDGGQYRVLDPKSGVLGTLASPKELALTLGGHAYDLASGIGTTLATAAGGIAGAPAGGVGALPAAALAGAGAGAGFEGLREGLGKLLGIKQDFQPGSIALSGAAGAAAPVLFGTGATAAQMGAKALESGLAPEAVAASQRGLLGRAADLAAKPLGSAAAKVAGLASGLPADTVKTYAANPATIAAMEASPTAITDLTTTAAQELKGKLQALHDELDKAVPFGASTDELRPLLEKAQPLFENPKKLYSAMKSTDPLAQEELKQFDTLLGTSLLEKSRTLQAYLQLQKSTAARQGAMATLGGLAGGAAGYHEGGAAGGWAGAAGGAALGASVGGPAAIRRYIDLLSKAKGAAGALPNGTMPAAATSAWNSMGGAQ